MNEIKIQRSLNLKKIVQEKSVFLLGPRQTGKSTWVKMSLPNATYYNLLYNDVFLSFQKNPSRLREEIKENSKIVVIDEIQKIPALLNEVHALIEEKGVKFILTGSSARKLRRGDVNLLGGRARTKYFHPFTYNELKKNFNLERTLNFGLLPGLYFSHSPLENLRDYTGTYLKEEILSEGLTRNIGSFSRFLETAALCNSQMINYTKVANDAQIPVSTVKNYFQILYDTLLGYEVTPWVKSIKRKAIQTAKFYFFDIGVVHSLLDRRNVSIGTPEFGFAFETFIFHELKAHIDNESQGQINYWQSTSGKEVDFILNNEIAIEVKGKKIISPDDYGGLLALQEEKKQKRFVVVSLEPRYRKVKNIEIYPWKEFLEEFCS